jgi:hypothetical protein
MIQWISSATQRPWEKEAMVGTSKVVSWVVYKMTLHGKAVGVNAVCEQAEWDAMELSRPGYHLLIQSGITNEAEAERLARSAQSDPSRP